MKSGDFVKCNDWQTDIFFLLAMTSEKLMTLFP